MEKIEQIFEKPNNKTERKDGATIFRHSIARYQLDEGICSSENPEAKPLAEDQWFEKDLTPEGVELAEKEAEKYFDTLNPETDALFFVSSDLVRAAETAKIFMDVARRRGFEVIKPREEKREEESQQLHYRDMAEKLGEGYIRKINCLTLNHLESMIREKIFYPEIDYLNDRSIVKNLECISEDTKTKWAEARAIIESDNRGTWGNNYYAHSEAISRIFPNVKSAKEVYDTKFKSMLRLVKFAQQKILERNPSKNIRILGFSHENSFIYFLNEEFGESIKNCESVGFRLSDIGSERGEDSDKKLVEIVVEAKGGERKFTEERQNKWVMQ